MNSRAGIVSAAAVPMIYGDDPVFAAIAAHRAAMAACAAMSRHVDELDDGPALERALSAEGGANARESGARLAVFTTAPTTLAGVAALLDYVGQPDDHGIARHTILTGIRYGEAELLAASDGFPRHLAAALRRIIDAAPGWCHSGDAAAGPAAPPADRDFAATPGL